MRSSVLFGSFLLVLLLSLGTHLHVKYKASGLPRSENASLKKKKQTDVEEWLKSPLTWHFEQEPRGPKIESTDQKTRLKSEMIKQLPLMSKWCATCNSSLGKKNTKVGSGCMWVVLVASAVSTFKF